MCNTDSQNPKVSIIIPVHNAQRTLERCINSVMMQDYDNVECILIENASSDHSAAICVDYADKRNRIIASSINVRGVSHARNLGLSMASGDIIGFCDADDYIEPNAIKRVVEEFGRDTQVAAVFGAFYVGTPHEEGMEKSYRGLRHQLISPAKALKYTLVNDCVMGAVWNKYYRAEFLDGICFDTELSYCEDMHFNARALHRMAAGCVISVLASPLYCYVQNRNSLTHRQDNLFDVNDTLKIVVAMQRIQDECKSDKTMVGILRMKIAQFSIESLQDGKLDAAKKIKMMSDIKENYVYLLRYMYESNIKRNIKDAYRGLFILMKDAISGKCRKNNDGESNACNQERIDKWKGISQ